MPKKDTRDGGNEANPRGAPVPKPDSQHAAVRRRLARRDPPPEQAPWQSTVVRVSTVIAVWLGY